MPVTADAGTGGLRPTYRDLAVFIFLEQLVRGPLARLNSLRVQLEHVVDERKVAPSVGMLRVDVAARDQVSFGLVVIVPLEMSQGQVVVGLSVRIVELDGLLESCDGLVVVLHLVEGYAEVEETLRRLASRDIQLVDGCVLQILPNVRFSCDRLEAIPNELQSMLLKVTLNVLFASLRSLLRLGAFNSTARLRPRRCLR